MEADERACPKCAETIKRAATKCRFCNSTFTSIPTEAEKTAAATRQAEANKGCLIGCGGLIAIIFILGVISSITQQIDFALHPEHKVQVEKEEKEQEAKEAKEQAVGNEATKRSAADEAATHKQKEADEIAKEVDEKNGRVEPGMQGFLNPGTFVFASLEARDEFYKAMYVHDNAGISELTDQGKMFVLGKRTPVLVLDRSFKDFSLVSECRMLDKKAHGAKIWVNGEDVVLK